MSLDGLGVVLGVKGPEGVTLVYIPGAALMGLKIVPMHLVKSAGVDEKDPMGTNDSVAKEGFPQDEEDPFGFRS